MTRKLPARPGSHGLSSDALDIPCNVLQYLPIVNFDGLLSFMITSGQPLIKLEPAPPGPAAGPPPDPLACRRRGSAARSLSLPVARRPRQTPPALVSARRPAAVSPARTCLHE